MSDEHAQQLLYQMQMLESYFTDLTQRETSLYNVLREAGSAIESIKSIAEKSESDTLVPIGMGAFLKTSVSSKDKFVINVGAGIAIEKDKDSAINYLESRIKEVEVALQDTSAKRQQIAARIEQGQQEMNRLAQTAAVTKK